MPRRRIEDSTAAIRIEGGLFGSSFLERLRSGQVKFQSAKNFGIKGSLQEEIARSYEDAKVYWRLFKRRLEAADEGKVGEITRDRWVRPLLSLLGYQLKHQGMVEAGGKKYPIRYRVDETEGSPPVHVVPYNQDLSKAARGGRSPHGALQEYLNSSDHLWGIVTNGKALRLLRKVPFVRRQAYLEVDLEALMESDLPGDFSLFYRLFHRSRLPLTYTTAADSPIERYYQEALEQGERARDHLRGSVESFLEELGTGFLNGPNGDELARDPERLYQDLLRLAYRALFLLVAEGRGALHGNDLYYEAYSLNRLLDLSGEVQNYTDDYDLWQGLRVLFELLRNPELKIDGQPAASMLGLEVLNGQLFEPIELERDRFRVTNNSLLRAFRNLAYYYDDKEKLYRRVNYAALDVEELGSVYESLLDNAPVIQTASGRPRFAFVRGAERKKTGSYYTPESLVGAILKESLDPVVEERLQSAQTPEEKEEAILSIKVLDPASGSGHFLLGAARRLGRKLAQVRTGEDEPAPEKYREAVRDVVQHCLYAVDKNPMAVELCRVALWIESYTPGKPLSFLDHRVKCGDSLVGVVDPQMLKNGIPDGAFSAKTGDDEAVAKQVKKENKKERRGEQKIFKPNIFVATSAKIAEAVGKLTELPEATTWQVKAKARAYYNLRNDAELKRLALASNLWTAAFFQPLSGNGPFITTSTVLDALSGEQVDGSLEELAEALAQKHRFFHWWLEFPEVFLDKAGQFKEGGGFDVIVGNPPWEVVQPEEENFFLGKDNEIASAVGDARKNLIKSLQLRNATLANTWESYVRETHALANFIGSSGRFPLTSSGKKNLYPAFAELNRNLLGAGRSAALLASGISSDKSNKTFFNDVIQKGELAALFGFQNREKIFSDIGTSITFAIFSLQKPGDPTRPAKMLFFATRVEHLQDERRIFSLTPEEFALLNPNTRTCPTFRSKADAELAKTIYRKVPVLLRKAQDGRLEKNPWNISLRQGLFNMTNASHLFKTRPMLEDEGFTLIRNIFISKDKIYLPLYEGKMIWQFNHRHSTMEENFYECPKNPPWLNTGPRELGDPQYWPLPCRWVSRDEVEARLTRKDHDGRELWRWGREWILGFRDVARSTDERTAIFALVPRVGVGNTLSLVFFNTSNNINAILSGAFMANWNTLVVDYIAKLKIPGMHMNFHFIEQFPVLSPSAYTPERLRFLVPRVLELVYTAWDMAPFAQDVWRELEDPSVMPPEAAESIRREVARRFAEHYGVGLEEAKRDPRFAPPEWLEGEYPFPPFGWDEDRRARVRAELDAYYAKLYGLNRKQLRYILDPADLTEREIETLTTDDHEEVADPLDPAAYEARTKASTFPSKTFDVLKRKETGKYGEYRTRTLVLQAWQEQNKGSI